jgi:hypothetical protein
MALFTRAPEKTAIKDRDAAKVNVDRLAGKLVEAEAAVIATKQAAQAAAMLTDDAALDVAEAAESAALRRHATIVAAHGEAGKMLAFLTEQIATAADQKQRAATNAQIVALADEFVEVGGAYLASTAAFVEVCTRALVVSTEFSGVATLPASFGIQVEGAIPGLAEELRTCGRRVLNHEAPAAYPVAELPFVPIIAARPETRHLFALRGISWKENGVLRVAQKFTDVDLPVKYAAKALKTNACCEIDSPLRNKSTLNQWGGHLPPESCFSLDGEPVTDIAEPREIVQHSAFEIVDRGPSYTLRVASGGA